MDPGKYYRKYLEKNLKNGYSYKEIKKAFVSQGHDAELLDVAYSEYKQSKILNIVLYGLIFLFGFVLVFNQYGANFLTGFLSYNISGDNVTLDLIYPIDNFTDVDGDIDFQYYINYNSTNITNCSLYVDGQLEHTNLNIFPDTYYNHSIFGFLSGQYEWEVNCSYYFCETNITPCPNDFICYPQTDNNFDFEWLNKTRNCDGSYTYRFKVTNNNKWALSYVAIELPSGVIPIWPSDGSTYSGIFNNYGIENPTNNPFYSIKYETIGEGVKNGGYDIFEFMLNELVEDYEISIQAKAAKKIGTVEFDCTGLNCEDCNGSTNQNDPVQVCLPCGDCEGKVTNLTLKYLGDNASLITVIQKKDNGVVFNNTISSGENFSFVGNYKGTLGTEIRIYVDNILNTKIHTSCSEPIYIGMISGDFEILGGASLIGGPFCNINGTGYCYNITPEQNCYYGSIVSETRTFIIPEQELEIDLTKDYNPNMAGDNQEITTQLNLTITNASNPVYYFNVVDELPFTYNNATILFNNVDITNITTITTNSTHIDFTINNISQSGNYAYQDDLIQIIYTMQTNNFTNIINATAYATAVDIYNTTAHANATDLIYPLGASLIGQKDIISYVDNPQNFSVDVEFISPKGPVTGLALSDYLPSGSTVQNFSIYYYNDNLSMLVPLQLNQDYYVYKSNGTLVDGNFVDIYYYNLSFNFTNWNGYLYDNDSIILSYNVATLGGGEWVLPTIIAGFDPIYQKHIKTETIRPLNIPLFDVTVNLINNFISSGDNIDAIVSVMNVGGPKAKVDVLLSYSLKTIFGELITEKSQSFAVSDKVTKELQLSVPDNLDSGKYVFEAFVTYAGKEAMATEMFVIEESKLNYVYLVLGLALISIIFILMLRRS